MEENKIVIYQTDDGPDGRKGRDGEGGGESYQSEQLNHNSWN